MEQLDGYNTCEKCENDFINYVDKNKCPFCGHINKEIQCQNKK